MEFKTHAPFHIAMVGCLLITDCKPPKDKGQSSSPQIIEAATLVGIDPQEAQGMADLALHSQRETQVAPYFATLKAGENSAVKGLIMLNVSPETNGVRLVGWVLGLLAEGTFGFSIYESSECAQSAASKRGLHFNPTKAPHGNPDQGGAHHLGDLPNIRANQRGIARVDTLVSGINLSAEDPLSVINKTLVIHRDPDDFVSQPSGNSGPALGCGVIGDENQLSQR